MFSTGAEVDVLPPLPVPVHSTSSPPPASFSNHEDLHTVPRSASYTNLPRVQESQPAEGIKRTFSDNVLASSPGEAPKNGRSPYLASKDLLRSVSKGKAKVAVAKFTLSAEDLESETRKGRKRSSAVEITEKQKPTPSRSVSSAFRNLARKSWRTSSRSPSPSPKEVKKRAKSRNVSPEKKQSISIGSQPVTAPLSVMSRPPSPSDDVELRISPGKTPLPQQRQQSQAKKSRRPLSAIIQKKKSEPELTLSKTPSLQSLRSRASSDKLAKLPLAQVPPIPSSLSTDRLSSASVDINKKKDPLWTVFRTLEADYQK